MRSGLPKEIQRSVVLAFASSISELLNSGFLFEGACILPGPDSPAKQRLTEGFGRRPQPD